MNLHQSLDDRDRCRKSRGAPVACGRDMVRFEMVSKVYPAYRDKPSVQALRGIDFGIPRGSITGVIGRSVAGNSSLVDRGHIVEQGYAAAVFTHPRHPVT